MNWSFNTLLALHISTVALFLFVVALVLHRRGLFRWTGAGFWAWASFLLYFVLNPYFSLQENNISRYILNLSIAGGNDRVIWILIVVVFGMISFFWAYLRTQTGSVRWRLIDDKVTVPMIFCAVLFATFGAFSLLTFRSYVLSSDRQMVIEGGRFVGQVTGYENAGYMFLVVPILLFISSDSRILRTVGWLFAGIFLFLALPSGWSRFALVSLLLAVSLADVMRRRAAWPRGYFVALLLVFTVILQLRGHVEWSLETIGNELLSLSGQAVKNVGSAMGSAEVSALSTWYLESYLTERFTGYSFGLPVINYLLTGWIPSRFLPQKYFLIDWLNQQRPYLGNTVNSLLYGSKSTLLGSFYNEGGVLGVILLAAAAGFLSRKLDGMLLPQSPSLVRATGVAWLSVLWMVWGSSDTWGIMALGILAMPTLAMWLFAPKAHRSGIVQSPFLWRNKHG